MDIDLVILWVDGNDSEHIKILNKYKNMQNTEITPEATITARFRNNDELKYLLRSVEKNAKFIRYIHLVTNGQIPKWLNTNNPKIKLVTHSQIMPQSALPTFSSPAIEACIVNIPDLSDHFLYSNDDFFIARPVSESFFFNKRGYPVVRLKTNYHPEKKAVKCYDTRQQFTSEIFFSKFNKKMNFFEHHNIDAFYKPDVLKCIEIFKKEFDAVTNYRFRQPYTVSKMIWSFYSLYLGHADLKHEWIHKIPNSLRCISKVLFSLLRESKMIGYEEKKYNLPKNIKLFCINDNEVSDDVSVNRGIEFLKSYFPEKSYFEL